MIRVAIAVEGSTEEAFVKKILHDYLLVEKCVEVRSIPLHGNITVQRLALYMANLFWESDFVTSLVDFYGFKDKGEKTIEELEESISDEVVKKIHRSNLDQRRIFPYIQQYEFEGLLFSNVQSFRQVPMIDEECLTSLSQIRRQFETPEDINDNSLTAPSKRITALIPTYHKVLHGPLVAGETGLDSIRNECPRFCNWLNRLESLGPGNDAE